MRKNSNFHIPFICCVTHRTFCHDTSHPFLVTERLQNYWILGGTWTKYYMVSSSENGGDTWMTCDFPAAKAWTADLFHHLEWITKTLIQNKTSGTTIDSRSVQKMVTMKSQPG